MQAPQFQTDLARRRRRGAQVDRVNADDLPAYPAQMIEAVEGALKELPRHQLWFTYRDIRKYFGVSRATVARRLRERLVPGIAMEGEHVIEEGAVRRFDRMQLKWILLAARYRGRACDPTSAV